jgi:hypothetical protein
MYYYWPCKSQASWVGALIFYISCYLKAASSFLTALKRQVSYNITRTHAHVLSCCVSQAAGGYHNNGRMEDDAYIQFLIGILTVCTVTLALPDETLSQDTSFYSWSV